MITKSLSHILTHLGYKQGIQITKSLREYPHWCTLFFHTSVVIKNEEKSDKSKVTTAEKSQNIKSSVQRDFKHVESIHPFSQNYYPHEDHQQDPMDPYPDRIRYRKKYSNPFERTFGIMKDDILELFGKLKHNPVVYIRNPEEIEKYDMKYKKHVFPEHCDVVIVGGGLVGVSIAYHLQERAREGLRIVVVERDLSYSKASSVLSVGGIRQQFSIPENIVLSKYGMDFLQTGPLLLALEGQAPPDFGINFHGYLILASEQGMPQLQTNYNLQREYGSYVKLLTKRMLKERYPWIETDGIEGGVVGTQREGWFDPWSLLLALVKKAKELGTHFVEAEMYAATLRELGDYVIEEDNPTTMRRVMNILVKLPSGETRSITSSLCVIAAGAWSQEAGHLLGIGNSESGMRSFPIPVEPRKRYVYAVKCPNGPGLNCPLVTDSDGTYFRREGLADIYLCGKSPNEEEGEPSTEDLSVDETFFQDVVWPNIAKRCKLFENLKLHSSWAGYYDYNTLDQNAIIGRHPLYSNLYMATGFSGHGVQQATGAGKALTELILDGKFKTLNMERLGFDRVILNEPLFEKCIY